MKVNSARASEVCGHRGAKRCSGQAEMWAPRLHGLWCGAASPAESIASPIPLVLDIHPG